MKIWSLGNIISKNTREKTCSLAGRTSNAGNKEAIKTANSRYWVKSIIAYLLIPLVLMISGWANTKELLAKISNYGKHLTFEELQFVVENNDKKRFSFSKNFSKIPTNQGHPINLDLQLSKKAPSEFLFHGTAGRNLDSIRNRGILKGQRHHVHLSSDEKQPLKQARDTTNLLY